MVAVAVGVYPLLAPLEEFRLYDARVDVVVNFSVQDISARVLLGVQNYIDVDGAERLASVEDTALGGLILCYLAVCALDCVVACT